MLVRDRERLADCRKRINVMPLGSAALAGTTYPIDREFTAKELGFDGIAENSLDGVSDRDFAIEFVSASSLVMMHLSRFSEELVLWSSAQFDFVDLGDSFCTGSSIMPQKKNPDVPELVRGKTGRIYGHLMSLLTLMKSQPLAYNKDNQEDKEPLFDTVDNLRGCLRLYADMMPQITVKKDKMYAAARKSVGYGVETGKDLSDMSLDELKNFSDIIEQDVFEVLTLEGSVAARNHRGGTAPVQVKKQIERLKKSI